MTRILITIGDPCGIGPEIALKAADNLINRNIDFIPILIGDEAVIRKAKERFNIKRNLCRWNGKSEKSEIFFVDTGIIKTDIFPFCKDSKLSGSASFEYLKTAWDMLKKNLGDCLVTGPISKTAWNIAGIPYKGHTDALSDISGEKTSMLMTAGKLRVLLATAHIPMKKIWKYLTPEYLFSCTKMTVEFIEKFFAIKNIKIGFCGLNPHAGEAGSLGTEEDTIIGPAIEKLKSFGFCASGPYPADSIFRTSLVHNSFDLIVSLYHDQALIVLKTLFFDKLVNITVNTSGWIRTSPGHGTAFDIAWKNMADPSSMEEAIKIAAEMARRKQNGYISES